MHYHCEVHLDKYPEDVFETVYQILKPYSINSEVYLDKYPKDAFEAIHQILKSYSININSDGFYDWFVIGGRWSGVHTLMLLDPEKVDRFFKICEEKELFWIGPGRPEEVQETRRYREFMKLFPDFKGIVPTCRDIYRLNGYPDDIIEVEKVNERLTCYTLVLPNEILHQEEWDGKQFRKTGFDGCVKKELDKRGITTGYLVTVDYHC